MRQELKEIEDKILHKLSASEGSPVDDIDLIHTLEQSKAKSMEIKVLERGPGGLPYQKRRRGCSSYHLGVQPNEVQSRTRAGGFRDLSGYWALELIPLKSERHFKPRQQSRILVRLRDSSQTVQRAAPTFLYGSSSPPPLPQERGSIFKGTLLRIFWV